MSFGEEWLNENAYEINQRESFGEKLECKKEELSEKTDNEILRIAIKCGQDLNEVTEHFPAYDVALRLLNNNWTPTEKQRRAIINVTAFYKTKRMFMAKYGHEEFF